MPSVKAKAFRSVFMAQELTSATSARQVIVHQRQISLPTHLTADFSFPSFTLYPHPSQFPIFSLLQTMSFQSAWSFGMYDTMIL